MAPAGVFCDEPEGITGKARSFQDCLNLVKKVYRHQIEGSVKKLVVWIRKELRAESRDTGKKRDDNEYDRIIAGFLVWLIDHDLQAEAESDRSIAVKRFSKCLLPLSLVSHAVRVNSFSKSPEGCQTVQGIPRRWMFEC